MSLVPTARSVALGLWIAAIMLPAVSRAQGWTEPHPGVRHLVRDGEVTVHAVEVDLASPEVMVVATPPGREIATVSGFATTEGAAVAINANRFNRQNGMVCGLARGGGVTWDGKMYGLDTCPMVLAVSRSDNRAEILEAPGQDALQWAEDVVAGGPALVRDGAAVPFDCQEASGFLCGRYARTAVGLDRDGRTMFLVVVDGGNGRSVGMNCPELAALMVELGAFEAFGLDYGPSSELYVQGEGGVVSCPSTGDCEERPVANHLGVVVTPGQGWYAARLAEQAPDPTVAPGQTVERVVRYENTGRVTWRSDGPHPVFLGALAAGDGSPLYDPDTWPSQVFAAGLAATVPSGEIGTFRVSLRGAPVPGTYEVSFAPVAVGAAQDGGDLWLDQEPVSWAVVVDGPADADRDGYDEDHDCDDQDPSRHPGAMELCNGKDDDCSGTPDDGVPPGRIARIFWTAASAGTLKLDGRVLDRSARWQEVRVVEVQLHDGENVVSVEASRGAGRGGVLVGVELPDGTVVPSNGRWEVATEPRDGWDRPQGPDDGFEPAVPSARFGQAPFDQGLEGWPQGVSPDGFLWIWTGEPDRDDLVYLRRRVFEEVRCQVEGGVGACGEGIWTCRDGRIRCVPSVTPGQRRETCNQVDDDCDGLTDEGLAGCATADDAGPPLPDLGPDLGVAMVTVTPEVFGGREETMEGLGACQVTGSGATTWAGWLPRLLSRR